MKTARIVVLAIVLGAGSVAPCVASSAEPARVTAPGPLAIATSLTTASTRHHPRPDAIAPVAGFADSDRAPTMTTQQ